MSRLDFSVADLNLPEARDKTRRASISGVQDKVQLKRIRGKFVVVDSGGDYILKPVPRNTSAELAADIPANEAVTMDIAGRLFGIKVAEHELVEMKDGEKAYLTRRFDRRGGEPIQQEDFRQRRTARTTSTMRATRSWRNSCGVSALRRRWRIQRCSSLSCLTTSSRMETHT